MIYFRHFWTKQPRSGFYASLFLVLALACHSVFLIARGVESSHAPFVGLHESMSFFAWLIAVVYLFLERRFRDRSLGVFVLPLVLAAQTASTALMSPVDPLPPLLQSPWFNFHVTASFLAYAAFSFTFITGLLYVMQMYYIHHRRVGLVFSRLPALGMLDEMNLKATLIGWVGHLHLPAGYPLYRGLGGRTGGHHLHGRVRLRAAGLFRRRNLDQSAHFRLIQENHRKNFPVHDGSQAMKR